MFEMVLYTEFVEDETIRLNTFAELIRFTANQYRHIMCFGNQSNLCCTDLTHDVAIAQ